MLLLRRGSAPRQISPSIRVPSHLSPLPSSFPISFFCYSRRFSNGDEVAEPRPRHRRGTTSRWHAGGPSTRLRRMHTGVIVLGQQVSAGFRAVRLVPKVYLSLSTTRPPPPPPPPHSPRRLQKLPKG